MSFKMADGDKKIWDHIDKFSDLVVDIQNVGEDILNEKKSLHFISSLTLSHQTLSRVLLHRDRTTISYNKVISAFLADNLQQKLMVLSHSSTSSSNATALNVNRGRPKWRTKVGFRSSEDTSRFNFGSKSWSKRTCFKCGKPGHVQKDCCVKTFTKPSGNV